MHLHIPLLPKHPIVRPIATFLFLALMTYSLLAHWQQHGGGKPMFDESLEHNAFVHEADRPKPDTQVGAVAPADKPMTPGGDTRKVVAHFMVRPSPSRGGADGSWATRTPSRSGIGRRRSTSPRTAGSTR